MVANKGLMEIIREFAEEHPLSGYDALEIEQHRELCQIISDYGYRSIDLKEVRKEIGELALSLPEKYVAKTDLDNLINFINERFNKLESKIDDLKK